MVLFTERKLMADIALEVGRRFPGFAVSPVESVYAMDALMIRVLLTPGLDGDGVCADFVPSGSRWVVIVGMMIDDLIQPIDDRTFGELGIGTAEGVPRVVSGIQEALETLVRVTREVDGAPLIDTGRVADTVPEPRSPAPQAWSSPPQAVPPSRWHPLPIVGFVLALTAFPIGFAYVAGLVVAVAAVASSAVALARVDWRVHRGFRLAIGGIVIGGIWVIGCTVFLLDTFVFSPGSSP